MRQEEKTKLTKQKILQAAIQEFGSKGYGGASLNAICESGIAKGLVYHNFKNKDSLYLACVKFCFQSLTTCLQEADIGHNLEKYMQVRMKYFKEHPTEARIFFDAVLQPPGELADSICELKKEFDAYSRSLYGEILNSMQLREGITYEDAMNYFTMLQDMFNSSFSSRNISLADKMDMHERDLPKLLDFMLYGIARRDDLC